MAQIELKNMVKKHIEQSKKLWSDKPPLTEKELKAIQEFESKKMEIFDKLLDTPEKVKRINDMLKPA